MLGAGIFVIGVLIRNLRDRADMNECLGAGLTRRFGHPARRQSHQFLQIAVEAAHEVYHGIGPLDALFDAPPVGCVHSSKLQLAEIGEGFQLESVAGMATANPQSRTAREQRLCHVIAQKAGATHQHYRLAIQCTAFGHVLFSERGYSNSLGVALAATCKPLQAFRVARLRE